MMSYSEGKIFDKIIVHRTHTQFVVYCHTYKMNIYVNLFVCRCGKLKKLLLNSNRLITLPDILHLLPELEVSYQKQCIHITHCNMLVWYLLQRAFVCLRKFMF